MFLGIDCGTQGTKALIVAEQGEALGRGYAAHHLIEKPNGAREQDPSWWVQAMISAIRAAGAQAPGSLARIRALAVSGQQHGLVVLERRFVSTTCVMSIRRAPSSCRFI